jgi:putative redox protein
MDNIVETSVELINDKIMFKGTAGSYPDIITDYVPPLGEGKGYMPLQIFLISLSACLGGTIAPLLRRMGKNIEALSIQAKGQRREQHPTGFERIQLDISIKSGDITEDDMKKAVNMSEEKYCPVLSMIKGNVVVSINYEIIK